MLGRSLSFSFVLVFHWVVVGGLGLGQGVCGRGCGRFGSDAPCLGLGLLWSEQVGPILACCLLQLLYKVYNNYILRTMIKSKYNRIDVIWTRCYIME